MTKWTPHQTEFEYSLVNGGSKLLYLGQADMWIAPDDPRWTVRRFTWSVVADGTTQLTVVETLGDVAWSNRATLNWT